MELKIKTLDGIEIGLQEYNDNELNELINGLRSQHINAGSMCDNLDDELITQNGISLLLFNTIMPRLKPNDIKNYVALSVERMNT